MKPYNYTQNMFKKIILALAILFYMQTANASEIEQFVIDKPYPAPNFQFSDDASVIHNLTDYKGKVVFLNFWATWCEPCVHEMPAIAKLLKIMESRDVDVLPVSVDFKGAAAIKQFYSEQKITNLPVYMDDKKAFKEFKLQALPTTIVIDRKGMIIAKIIGEIDWGNKENQDYLLSVGK